MDDSKFSSLQELIDSINLGLDIEFYLYGVRYNISPRGNKKFIAVCPDGDAYLYDTGENMANKHNINGKLLKDIWQDIEIRSM